MTLSNREKNSMIREVLRNHRGYDITHTLSQAKKNEIFEKMLQSYPNVPVAYLRNVRAYGIKEVNNRIRNGGNLRQGLVGFS